jgi:hypothetical protein
VTKAHTPHRVHDPRPAHDPRIALNATENRSRRMFDPIGTVSITLGSVVLDRPDRTGRYFAKDLAGGWAYLVGDAEGDNRFRGHGVCEGGLDTTLRCAFLSAVNRIPDGGRIRILVETRQAHRMIVQLARRDPHVVAAIAGRPVAVLTVPEERSSHQVRSAAERAASTALRDREHAEWHASEAEAGGSDGVGAEAVDTVAGPIRVRSGGAPEMGASEGGAEELSAMRDWRARRRAEGLRAVKGAGSVDGRSTRTAPVAPVPNAAVRWLVGPLMDSARNRLAAAGILAPSAPRRSRAVTEWLQEFDRNVAAVTNELHDVDA